MSVALAGLVRKCGKRMDLADAGLVRLAEDANLKASRFTLRSHVMSAKEIVLDLVQRMPNTA